MKLRVLLVAIFSILTINSFAQFEKKSIHLAFSLTSYVKYGGLISYFPAKNLELGLGYSVYSSAKSQIKTKRSAINYKMNYYISDLPIKPKIVGTLAFIKNDMDIDRVYGLSLRYHSFNAGIGAGISAKFNKRIRIEGDITINKFIFKPEKGAYNEIHEEQQPTKFILGATLSYQIFKLK